MGGVVDPRRAAIEAARIAIVSDNELLTRAAEGDADALSALLERHGPNVRRRIARSIPARWRSLLSDDDVMQQTYADAFRTIDRFTSQGEGSLERWLARLAKCNLQDAIKGLEAEKRGGQRRRVGAPDLDRSYADLLEQLPGSWTTPSRSAAKNEARVALDEAIGGLSETYRNVIRLYDLEGRAIEEVAEVMGRSQGAVYMLRARAHDRLRQTLGAASQFLDSS